MRASTKCGIVPSPEGDLANVRLQEKIDLPGGRDRARDSILYVAKECVRATRFGQVKLNKILWRADFESFSHRGVPVTGRKYQHLPQGPCLVEMVPLQRSMLESGLIRIDQIDLGSGFVEDRVVVQAVVKSELLNDDDYFYLDRSIQHYWDKTAREASDQSHGVAWKITPDKKSIFYELSILSDEIPSQEQMRRLEIEGERRGWFSL